MQQRPCNPLTHGMTLRLVGWPTPPLDEVGTAPAGVRTRQACAAVDALRASDYRRLDAGRHVSLEYPGGGPHADSQVRDRLRHRARSLSARRKMSGAPDRDALPMVEAHHEWCALETVDERAGSGCVALDDAGRGGGTRGDPYLDGGPAERGWPTVDDEPRPRGA